MLGYAWLSVHFKIQTNNRLIVSFFQAYFFPDQFQFSQSLAPLSYCAHVLFRFPVWLSAITMRKTSYLTIVSVL